MSALSNCPNRERDIAIREANEIAASDEYFSARPQLESADRRRVFEAGFRAAWNRRTVPEGWKLVPVVPTPEMIAAIPWPTNVTPRYGIDIYHDMIAAAPKPGEE